MSLARARFLFFKAQLPEHKEWHARGAPSGRMLGGGACKRVGDEVQAPVIHGREPGP